MYLCSEVNPMRKVLLITYYYHQREQIGSIRINGLVNYLPLFGWEPVVLTVKSPNPLPSQCKIISTDYQEADTVFPKLLGINPNKPLSAQKSVISNKDENILVNSLLFLYQDITYYPDPQKGWKNFALKEAIELLESEKVDAIISSAMPYTAHIIASRLKKRFHIPWVADFRDLWTQNHIFRRSTIRKLLETKLERNTLSQANAITTVSEPLAKKLSILHGHAPIYSVTNGFDPSQYMTGGPISTCFNIIYTGTIYNKKQDPEPLFIALRHLIDDNLIDPSIFRVDFYGYQKVWVTDEIHKYDLDNVVFLHEAVSRDVSIALQRNAQVLLLLAWNDPHEKGIYTGKIFDYLAAQRPILCIGGAESVVEDLLLQTRTGKNLESPSDISNCLLNWYNEYLSTGCVKYLGKGKEVLNYTHVEMAKQFAGILDRVVKPDFPDL